VQDPVTGTFVGDYFRRRAAEEVALAQQRGVPAALIGLGLGDGVGAPLSQKPGFQVTVSFERSRPVHAFQKTAFRVPNVY